MEEHGPLKPNGCSMSCAGHIHSHSPFHLMWPLGCSASKRILRSCTQAHWSKRMFAWVLPTCLSIRHLVVASFSVKTASLCRPLASTLPPRAFRKWVVMCAYSGISITWLAGVRPLRTSSTSSSYEEHNNHLALL